MAEFDFNNIKEQKYKCSNKYCGWEGKEPDVSNYYGKDIVYICPSCDNIVGIVDKCYIVYVKDCNSLFNQDTNIVCLWCNRDNKFTKFKFKLNMQEMRLEMICPDCKLPFIIQVGVE